MACSILRQFLLQRLNQPLHALRHGPRQPSAGHEMLLSVALPLEQPFQVGAAAQQLLQGRHLLWERLPGKPALLRPILGQQQRILPIRFGAPALAARPVAHLARVGQCHLPALLRGPQRHPQFIAPGRLQHHDQASHLLSRQTGRDLAAQGVPACRAVGDGFQPHRLLRLPEGSGQHRFAHIKAQRGHIARSFRLRPAHALVSERDALHSLRGAGVLHRSAPRLRCLGGLTAVSRNQSSTALDEGGTLSARQARSPGRVCVLSPSLYDTRWVSPISIVSGRLTV